MNDIDNPTFFGTKYNLKYVQRPIKISSSEYALRVFISLLKSLINKQNKKRLMNGRLHQLLHYPNYINEFGSPSNFNGSVPESMNKELAKKVGSRTQQRWDSIHTQAATRFFENCLIRIATNVATKSGKLYQKLDIRC